jgi:hypothetical protein
MPTLSIFDANGVNRTSRGELFGIEVKVKGKSHKSIISIDDILQLVKNHPTYIEKTLSLAGENKEEETQVKKFNHFRIGV